jgi:hypothetical protein
VTEAIIVGAIQESAPGTNVTISDSAGDTFTTEWYLATFLSHNSTGVFRAFNVPSGVTWVKLVPGTGVGYCGLSATHIKRTSGSWAVDQTGAALTASQTTPWTSPLVTTTTANEVLVGETWTGNGTGGCVDTLTGSWTAAFNQPTGSGHVLAVGTQVVSGIQTNIGFTGTTTVCTGGFGSAPGVITYK